MFPNYVSLETATLARFNYWEASTIFKKNSWSYSAYVSYISELELTIAIIEGVTRDSRKRTEFYFGTIPSDSQAIDKSMYESLQNIIKRKNRIAGKNLEKAIHEIIDPIVEIQT